MSVMVQVNMPDDVRARAEGVGADAPPAAITAWLDAACKHALTDEGYAHPDFAGQSVA